MYRDAALVYAASVALHCEHAAHERLAARLRDRGAGQPTWAPGKRSPNLASRDPQLSRTQAHAADQRDAELDARERGADERDLMPI